MNNCSILFNLAEDESFYFRKLREHFLKEGKFDHYLGLIRNGLGLLKVSSRVLAGFEDREDFFIELEADNPEQEYERILSGNPERLFALEIAFHKLGYDRKDLKKLRDKYGGDQLFFRIFDEVKSRTDFKLTDTIDVFKKDLAKFTLNTDWFLMIHQALMMAHVDFELERLVELGPINRPSDIFRRLPSVIHSHLSAPAKQKLLKLYKPELDRITANQKEILKESELFLFRIHERLKEMIDELSRELKETLFKMEKLIDRTDVIRHINQLTSKLQRMLLMQLHHFQDHEAKRKESLDLLAQFEHIDAGRPSKNVQSIYEEVVFFRCVKPPTAKVGKRFAEYLISMIDAKIRKRKQKRIELLRNYERKGMLGVSLDADLILENYISFVRKVFLPTVINQLFEDMVVVWPYGDGSRDFAYFAGVYLKKEQPYPKKVKHYLNSLHRTISVLTYDIRGSTYMGTRLKNAEKEWKIKYKFSQIMSGIAKRFGGYLLKDTGDGGVVWFGENSKETYERSYIESIATKGVKIRQSIFSGREFELHPSSDAGIRAIQCGLEMVKAAEEFIKINFIHYRDWFGEVSKREVKVEGVTYALLPPEFRSLFRIGVGIASGQPNRDIFFGVNSYGDPDVVGPLLSESHLYSMGRDPNRSVVIIDSPTLLNILVNSSIFGYFGLDEKDTKTMVNEVAQLRDKMRDYFFPDYQFRAVRSGIHLLEEADKMRALDFGYQGEVLVDDEGIFYNQADAKINLLYEVIGE
ncbi:MAG TPA: adenylate/guanylate cyclase domain-containing protein [bacterium (Candidatus Stahlbacteria)]|nr:adenylate/guanylate cyclase domain-containing protein [Candidatus Stahlbacteria bacterium]